jgi:DNA-binding NarL/FixJ family response regulator
MLKTSTNKPLEIIVVDDHQMFIDGLKALLRKETNIKITAEALNGFQALEILNQKTFDLAIIDISMPLMLGSELIKIIKKDFPQIKILVVTMYNDIGIIKEILNAEADGYILKNTGKKELLEAINKISDNGTYYSNEVVSILMEKERKKNNGQSEIIKSLTERELQIIRLIGKEYSSAQIADELYISHYTVDAHRRNILKKTNTRTFVGLIKFAIENNLLEPQEI